MKSLFQIPALMALLQLCRTALTATPLVLSNSASLLDFPLFNSSCRPTISVSNLKNRLPPDPYQKRVPGTTTSLIFSNFRKDPLIIHPENLLAVGYRAQYEFLNNIVANHGDGPVAQPNFAWKNYGTFLRMNHKLDDKITWLMLAQAVHGIMDWGYSVAMITTDVTILDDDAGVVGTASLTVEASPTA